MRLLVRLIAAVVAVWLVACESTPARGSTSSWTAIDALGRREPTLASLLAPRRDAFMRAPSEEGEDAASRGRIVSEGWRATKAQHFEQLGARLPDDASGAMDVGPSRFESLHVRVWLEGARASEARIVDGRVLYENALPGADRVVTSNSTTLEELLVLRDDSAARSFTWKMELPEGLRVSASDAHGGYRFVDAGGAPRLLLAEPLAYDAAGKHIALQVAWNDAAQKLSVTLPEGQYAYPVVVDPRYDSSLWFNTSDRLPSQRSRHALAYDSTRRETVLFGGYLGTANVYDDTWVWNAATAKWARQVGAGPTARYGHAMVYDAARNQIVLFGGSTATTLLGDTWTWTGATATWTKAAPAVSPPARFGHALAYDSARSEVVLFGGGTSAATLNDTWVWNGTTWTQRTPASAPTARFFHAMSYDSARGEVVVFGGAAGLAAGAGDQPTDDTWVWNGAASTWTQRTVATRPSARSGVSMAFDSDRGETVLFGGGPTTTLGDTWVWNGTAWVQRSPALNPPARSDHATVYDSTRHEVLVFAGNATGAGPVPRVELWAWSGATGTWEVRAPIGPTRRAGHALAYDTMRHEVLLFGGAVNESVSGPDVLNNETWIWRGSSSTWTRQAPSASPSPRRSHTLTYDSTNDQMVLFGGGGDAGALFNDTWVYAGSGTRTWTRKTLAQSPSARRGHAATFDSGRNEIVMYGGDGLSDTWIWNGATSTWTQRTPATSPGIKGGHSLTYDPARREAILFGGGAPGPVVELLSDETWVWSGTAGTWTKRVIAGTGPAARRGHAMIYDTQRAQFLLFGGSQGGFTGDSETWALSGTPPAWLRRTSLPSPPAVLAHAMAFDESRTETVLFGGGYTLPLGAGLTVDYNDTYLHRTLGGACSVNADCLEGSSCTDGVCCASASCGVCETCGGADTPGVCSPVINAEDPDTCAAKDGRSCSGTGLCRAALGVPAASASQCASGNLVDGVCCASPSCGACQTCDVTLAVSGVAPGTCGAIRAGTDPKNDCADQGAVSCGLNGVCDGLGACQRYGAGVACGTVACVDNRATGRICNGLGTCADSAAGVACGAYACSTDRGCKSSCATNDDCALLFHCESGQCAADRGAVCDGDHTVISAVGTPQDCGLYRCVGATCPKACASRTDCVVSAACDDTGHCVSLDATKPNEDPGGCSCGQAPRTPSGIPSLVAVLGAFGAFRARRRRGS